MPVLAGNQPYTGVPEVQPQFVPAPGFQIQARPEAFGALVGQRVEQLGERFGQAGNVLAANAIARQELQNQIVSDDTNNKFQEAATDLLYTGPNALFSKRGEDFLHAYQPAMQQLEALRRQHADQLNLPQQVQFNRESRYYLQHEFRNIGFRADEAQRQYGVDTAKATGDLAVRGIASQAEDDAAADRYTAQLMKARLAELGLRGEADNPDIVNATLAQARADSTTQRVRALARDNPTRAQQVLDDSRDVLKGAPYDQLKREVDAASNGKIVRDGASEALHLGAGRAPGGGFTAPQGAPIEGATQAEQQMLSEIRYRESGGNYKAVGKDVEGGARRGAFQFSDETWKEAAAATGQGRLYVHADAAPSAVQDANALWLLRNRGTAPWAASGPYPAIGAGASTQTAQARGGPQIIDKTDAAGFDTQFGPLEPVRGMVVHHTAGGRTVDDIIATEKKTGYPAQFIIDRQGKTYQVLPDGYQGRHIRDSYGPLGTGKTNANMEGVEIIADNDGDVLPVQEQAAARLISARSQKWGYDPRTSVFGHGELNPGHKEADEGMSTVTRIRNGSLAVQGPQEGAPDRVVGGAPPGAPVTTAAAAQPIPPGTAPAAPAPTSRSQVYGGTLEDRLKYVDDQVAAGRWTQEQGDAISERVERTWRAQVADEERLIAIRQREQRQRVEQSASDIVRRLTEDPTSVDPVKDIAENPAFTEDYQTRDHLLRIQREATAAGDKRDVKTYGSGFYKLYGQVHAAADDPNRLTDPNQLYSHVGPNGDLTVAGVDKLINEMQGRRTAEGEAWSEMQKQFFKNAHAQISGADELLHLKDPKGEELFLKFMAAALPQIEAKRAAGKSPSEIFNPDSPDYAGKLLDSRFKRPMSQRMADLMHDAEGPPDVSTPEAVKDAVAKNRITREQGIQIATERGWIQAAPPPGAPAAPIATPQVAPPPTPVPLVPPTPLPSGAAAAAIPPL